MTKQEAIQEFISRVNQLSDSNFGDFKRKTDLALTRMWEILGHDSKEIDNLIYGVKKQLVYSTGMDIEDARNLVIDTAEEIKKKIH